MIRSGGASRAVRSPSASTLMRGAGPPFRMILDSGIRAGGGSDAANVTAINPWLLMKSPLTLRPCERLI